MSPFLDVTCPLKQVYLAVLSSDLVVHLRGNLEDQLAVQELGDVVLGSSDENPVLDSGLLQQEPGQQKGIDFQHSMLMN